MSSNKDVKKHINYHIYTRCYPLYVPSKGPPLSRKSILMSSILKSPYSRFGNNSKFIKVIYILCKNLI